MVEFTRPVLQQKISVQEIRKKSPGGMNADLIFFFAES